MGERALLAEVDSLDEVLALHGALRADPPEGVIDLVPAARTVLVRVEPGRLAAARARVLQAAESGAAVAPAEARTVELDIAYDGADLGETAALLGVGVDELVRRHAAAEWSVAFTGFAPGFGYLVSPDWQFDVPRLAAPRTRVPGGAVGLAGGFTGAYPRQTPGGWRLIGTTSAALFDPVAASPVLLNPGDRVRFRAVPEVERPAAAATPVREGDALRVLDPGLLASVQDLGRAGHASIGVSTSGALDRGALRLANRLVGNAEDAAAIEITMGGLRAVAEREMWFVVTGARGAVTLDGRPVDANVAHLWPAGAELWVDWFAHGARAYLGVRGGIDAPAVLGSRSADVLAGLGTPALTAGARLGIRGAQRPIPVTDLAPWGMPPEELELEVLPGPRADWFTAEARAQLFEARWTVSAQADRVGVRLDGPALERARGGELPSEGMVPGAMQVPPTGRPVVLLADGPVTGGYPVIAVATEASLDLLAQARPGTGIRFRHARPPA